MKTTSAGPRRRVARTLGIGAFVLAVTGTTVAVVVILLFSITNLNPFATTTTDHPNSVVLAEVHDLARFEAASGRFQTILDTEHTTKLVPGWVSGDRVVLAAEGDVEATVDFAKLPDGAIELSADGKHATVHVPEPTLSEPRLDPEATRVIQRDRGIINRVGDAIGGGHPTDDPEVYKKASDKLAAAADRSDLRDRAKANTETFLRDSLRSAGVDSVTVVFDAPSPRQSA